MRHTSWRLRQRSASRRVFLSPCLRGQVVARGTVHSALGDGDPGDRAVELAVARCRRWRRRLSEEPGIGATPARRASLASDWLNSSREA